MNWTVFGHIADILAVASFILSLGIMRKITSKTEYQKGLYADERKQLMQNLNAIRQNVWDDGLISTAIQDDLQTKIFEYQMKYFFISSPRCLFHAYRCTYILGKGIDISNSSKLRQDVNFLIARLSKKE